jgi:hypothetical protein
VRRGVVAREHRRRVCGRAAAGASSVQADSDEAVSLGGASEEPMPWTIHRVTDQSPLQASGSRCLFIESRFCTAASKCCHLVTERSERVTRGASSSDWRTRCRPISARRPAGLPGRSSFSGDYRLRPASCGDFRPNPARDLRGMERSRRSICQIHMPICRDFTGATGLEPATSGVTGRRSNQLNYAPWAQAL